MSILWPMMRDTKFSKNPPKYSHSGQFQEVPAAPRSG